MAQTKEERTLYLKNYYKNNTDKVKLKNKLWSKNNPEKRKNIHLKYVLNNFEKVSIRAKNFQNNFKKRNQNFVNRIKLKFGCKFCGYKQHPQALHFDHIDKTKKYESISYLTKSSYTNIIKLKEEMRKCQILCANCHAVKTYQNKDYINNE